jgi:hypothetical protein
MSTKYKATMPDTGYFITITTVGWIDIFTRLKQRYVLINALTYCQKHKGLEIYAPLPHESFRVVYLNKTETSISHCTRFFNNSK